MALSHWANNRPDSFGGALQNFLGAFPDEFATLFETGPQRDYIQANHAFSSTAVDVKETRDAYKFVADLPGLKKEEVKVRIEEGNTLSISGERQQEQRDDTDTYHRVERTRGKFMRRFRLPQNADSGKVSATCKDGVLEVTVPKVPPQEPETPKTQEIAVQ